MLVFTDFVPDDAEFKGKNLINQLGLSFLAIIGANLLINLGIIVRQLLLQVIKYFKKRSYKTLKLKLDEKRKEQILIEQDIQVSIEKKEKVKEKNQGKEKKAEAGEKSVTVAGKRNRGSFYCGS